MDRCIVNGYRCPTWPILSAKTIALLEEARRVCRISDFAWATALRGQRVARSRDLTGEGLLALLTWLERNGLKVASFVDARRAVTPKQIQLLQVGRKQIRQEDQARYHKELVQLGGVNTSADLDERGVELMMAFLEDAGFARPKPAPVSGPTFGRRPGFASPEQLGLVRELWREWSGADDEAALTAWLERFHQISNLRFLTTTAAGKVITALKAMKRRRAAEASDGTAA